MNLKQTLAELLSDATAHGLTTGDISRDIDRLSAERCSDFGKFGLNRVRSLFSFLSDKGIELSDLLENDTEPPDLW